MIPETMLDQLNVPFSTKPVLVAGMAMQFYGLREGHDCDWIVSPQDFHQLLATFPDGYFHNPFGDDGIQVGPHEFYASLFGYCYCLLADHAIERQDHCIVHLELLLFLKTLAALYDPENAKARNDILLLIQKLGVETSASHRSLEEGKNNA